MNDPEQPKAHSRYVLSGFTTNVLFFIFSVAGLLLMPELTIKLNPTTRGNTLTVSFSYPGTSPIVVEQEVTSKLTGAFSTITGIQTISSISSHDKGTIALSLEKGVDANAVRFELLSLIKDLRHQLPENVGYPEIFIGQAEEKESSLLISYVLNGNEEMSKIREYAEMVLRPVFARQTGIYQIEISGGTPDELSIQYDPTLLSVMGISPDELTKIITTQKRQYRIGEGPDKESDIGVHIFPLILRLKNDFPDQDNWNSLPIKCKGNNIVRLGDLVKTDIKPQDPNFYFRINGMNTVTINLFSVGTANQLALSKELHGIEKKINENLPAGYSLIKMYDSSDYLKEELNKTINRTLFSLIVLFFFLLIVQRSFRYLLLIGLCLSANLFIAFLFYYFFHVEIHLISIAGITVSLGIIIDNFIMMADQLRYRNNKRMFLAMLGSVLSIMGALIVLFFLKEKEKQMMTDFAWVVLINLAVSLVVALFLLPVLTDKLRIRPRPLWAGRKMKKVSARFISLYRKYIIISGRHKWLFVVGAVFAFGIPLQQLPASLNDSQPAAPIYNSTLGSSFYKQSIKPITDRIFGGSLGLFLEKTKDAPSFHDVKETTLYLYLSLPDGASLGQMNELCKKFEQFIGGFEGIRQFQTRINGPQDASILIRFSNEKKYTSLPEELKGNLIRKTKDFNGADFYIFLHNDYFISAVPQGSRMWRIELSGYQYDELLKQATRACDSLTTNPRIRDVAIFSGKNTWRSINESEERYLFTNKEILFRQGIPFYSFAKKIAEYSTYSKQDGYIFWQNKYMPLRLTPHRQQEMDSWMLFHKPLQFDSLQFRLSDLATVTKIKTDAEIFRENQSYMLTIAFDFIGPEKLGQKVLKRETALLNQRLPLGFKAKLPEYYYANEHTGTFHFWIIGLIILIIWIICAILFESLLQPLAVIALIPLSFIGLFLTFYLFPISFDQGGFAAMILLSGLVVNMSIYIFNDINNMRLQKNLKPLNIYIKAFNIRIIPITLTTLTACLSLLPFLIFDQNAPFWYSFAAGTIGGLLFSIPMLILYLPLMVKMNRKIVEKMDESNNYIDLNQTLQKDD